MVLVESSNNSFFKWPGAGFPFGFFFNVTILFSIPLRHMVKATLINVRYLACSLSHQAPLPLLLSLIWLSGRSWIITLTYSTKIFILEGNSSLLAQKYLRDTYFCECSDDCGFKHLLSKHKSKMSKIIPKFFLDASINIKLIVVIILPRTPGYCCSFFDPIDTLYICPML